MQVINQNIANLPSSTINIFLYFPFLLLRKLISTVSLLNNCPTPQEAPKHKYKVGCKINIIKRHNKILHKHKRVIIIIQENFYCESR